MKKPIPEIRARLHELAEELNCPELHDLAEATRRKPAKRNAPVQSRRMNSELAVKIKAYAFHNPDAPLSKIAQLFNVNQGRVSEALNGQHD